MSGRWTTRGIVLTLLLLVAVAVVAHLGGGNLMRHLANHLHGGAAP